MKAIDLGQMYHPVAVTGLRLYFLCHGLKTQISILLEKGVQCSAVQEARWGSLAKILLPGGGEVGLYLPKHPTTLALQSK